MISVDTLDFGTLCASAKTQRDLGQHLESHAHGILLKTLAAGKSILKCTMLHSLVVYFESPNVEPISPHLTRLKVTVGFFTFC